MSRGMGAQLIRGVLSAVTAAAGQIMRFAASGRSGETFAERELLQQYGFGSRPLAGSEGIFLIQGQQVFCLATADKRYQIELADGEVSLFTDEGDRVHLKRGRVIEVIGGEKVKVSTKLAEIAATTKVTLDTPLVEASGDMTVAGDLAVTGALAVTGTSTLTGAVTAASTLAASGAIASAASIGDPTGTMADVRTTYNTHTHNETGSVTQAPNQSM